MASLVSSPNQVLVHLEFRVSEVVVLSRWRCHASTVMCPHLPPAAWQEHTHAHAPGLMTVCVHQSGSIKQNWLFISSAVLSSPPPLQPLKSAAVSPAVAALCVHAWMRLWCAYAIRRPPVTRSPKCASVLMGYVVLPWQQAGAPWERRRCLWCLSLSLSLFLPLLISPSSTLVHSAFPLSRCLRLNPHLLHAASFFFFFYLNVEQNIVVPLLFFF